MRALLPLTAWFIAGALGMAASTLQAATFEVTPVLLEMQGAQRVSSFTVVNREDHPTTIQIRPMIWRQVQGQDGLSTTADIQVSPPIFTVGPGETQLVRVFARQVASANGPQGEYAYRMLIDEIPSPSDVSAVHMALRISIPLFVYPGRTGAPALEWKLIAEGQDIPWITVTNNGTRRSKLATLVTTDAQGRRHEVAAARSAYVLPGAQRAWRLDGWPQDAQAPATLTVSGSADSGDISAQATRVSSK